MQFATFHTLIRVARVGVRKLSAFQVNLWAEVVFELVMFID